MEILICHAIFLLSLEGVVLSRVSGRPPEDRVFAPSEGNGPELVLLVAPAACGKSTLCERLVQEGSGGSRGRLMVRINQDTLGSFDACKAQAIKLLQKG